MEEHTPDNTHDLKASQNKATPDKITFPTLFKILHQPKEFFALLQTHPQSNARFLGLVCLIGALTGISGFFAQQPIQEALEALPKPYAPEDSSLIFSVLSSVVVGVLGWCILWWIAQMGIGKKARTAEVYGASMFPFLPISILGLLLAFVLPLQIDVPVPDLQALQASEDATAVPMAVLQYSLEVNAQGNAGIAGWAHNLLSFVGAAWMFYLAYTGFLGLSGNRKLAVRGVVMPMGFALLIMLALLLLMWVARGLIT